MENNLIQELDEKISAIIQFLFEHQEPDGEFKGLRFFTSEVENYVIESEYENWGYFGKCPFFTATILYHLEKIEHPLVDEIKKKGCQFLLRGVEDGLVRYVAPYYHRISFPIDIDDAAITILVLNLNGYKISANNSMILNNINEEGDLLCTWLVPRKKHLDSFSNYLWLLKDFVFWNINMLSFGTSLRRMRELWKEYRSAYEPAVVINYLLYSGINQNTEKYLEAVLDKLESEVVSLEYYDNLIVPYFHLARLYDSGVEQAIRLKEKIIEYIQKVQNPNGEFKQPLFSALACLTLIYFNCWDDPVFHQSVSYILNQEMFETGWKPFHFCNQAPATFLDGAAGVTAVFYLDILYRYREHLRNQ